MFNVFQNCYRKESFSSVTFNELVGIISDHPQKNEITYLRDLKKKNDLKFKKIKKEMMCISPNSNFTRRANQKNFAGTGYIYFDFDIPNPEDVEELKHKFITKFGNICSIICKSITYGGISVLVKIDKNIKTENEFKLVYNHILNNYFHQFLRINDIKVRFINALFFIPFDADVYYNRDCILSINSILNKKSIKHSIENTPPNNIDRLIPKTINYKLYPQNEVNLKLVYKTRYTTKNEIFDFNELEFTNVPYINQIKDGQKHKLYYTIIHILKFLNPEVEDDYIFSYLYYINKYYTDKPMNSRRLNEICDYAFSCINKNGYVFSNFYLKKFHFNAKNKLSKKEKMNIVNKVNGVIKKNKTIDKINNAKFELINLGQKITTKSLHMATGLSIATVKRYYRSIPVEINDFIEMMNELDKYSSSKS
jgi:hypothetical protein